MVFNLKKLFSDEQIPSPDIAISAAKNPSTEVSNPTPPDSLSSRIRKIQTESPSKADIGGTIQDGKNFIQSAKLFEPASRQFVNLADRIQRRKIRNNAEKAGLNGRAAEFEEMVSLKAESKTDASAALSRILARRVKNDEALDWSILIGIGAECYMGYSDVLKELKKIQAENKARAAGEKK